LSDAFVAEAENRPKSAHRYNVAEQQLIYKSEIERIWRAQFASLSRKDEPQLSDDEDDRKSQPPQRLARRESRAHSPLISFTGGPAAAASPGLSRASSIERDRDVSVGPDARRVMRIKRFVDGKWNIEIVRDAAVIRAYVRRRQIIEDETTGADTLAPTGDIDRDARAKKRYVGPFTPSFLFLLPLFPAKKKISFA
jgi:transcription initiation factor TFIID subunit 1, fungi type